MAYHVIDGKPYFYPDEIESMCKRHADAEPFKSQPELLDIIRGAAVIGYMDGCMRMREDMVAAQCGVADERTPIGPDQTGIVSATIREEPEPMDIDERLADQED